MSSGVFRLKAYGLKLFPIPMRGNEFICQRLCRLTLTPFPIPMRGNERTQSDDGLHKGAGFPIPMRGNESGKYEERAVAEVVSNPHEG